MSLMKGNPYAGYIYKSSFLIISSHSYYILIQLLLNIFLSLNGLLRTVLFILDIYIVNWLGSPQWYQSFVSVLGLWPPDLWVNIIVLGNISAGFWPLKTPKFRDSRSLIVNLAFGQMFSKTFK
jgi:hypothetical protein